jgi:hypothetical protein
MKSMRTRTLAIGAMLVVLAAVWAGAATARVPAAMRSTTTIVSQGLGHQVLEGGGLTYGTLAPGGAIRFVDLSAKHDAKYTVTAQIPATPAGAAAQTIAIKPIKVAGLYIFKVTKRGQAGKASLAFSVAGSKFRLVLDGTSILNGAGVSGRVTLDGTGTVAVNGQTPPIDWATEPRFTLPTKAAAAAKTTTSTTPTATSTTSS